MSNEEFSGLKETCSVGLPPVPAEWACSGKAAKIRGRHRELHKFCMVRGFVTLGEGYRKTLGKIMT